MYTEHFLYTQKHHVICMSEHFLYISKVAKVDFFSLHILYWFWSRKTILSSTIDLLQASGFQATKPHCCLQSTFCRLVVFKLQKTTHLQPTVCSLVPLTETAATVTSIKWCTVVRTPLMINAIVTSVKWCTVVRTPLTINATETSVKWCTVVRTSLMINATETSVKWCTVCVEDIFND